VREDALIEKKVERDWHAMHLPGVNVFVNYFGDFLTIFGKTLVFFLKTNPFFLP
jgi:hypothetical protein